MSRSSRPSRVIVHRRERLVDDYFKLDATEFSFERFDGTMSAPVRRLVLERGDSVAALLVDAGDVLLIEQFRLATHAQGPGWITELVAGVIAPGETAEQALRREAAEETGFALRDIEPIGSFYLSPGGSSERVHLFLAHVDGMAGPGGGDRSVGEDIRVVRYSRAQLRAEQRGGRFIDAKTQIAVQHYLGALA